MAGTRAVVFEPPPDLSLPLERDPGAPRRARAEIRHLLDTQASPEFLEDAQLLTSELVTNAVMYAPNGCRVSAWFVPDAPALRVEVSDSTGEMPTMRPANSADHRGGRGLRLVANRASDWGVDVRAGGKAVWFELRR